MISLSLISTACGKKDSGGSSGGSAEPAQQQIQAQGQPTAEDQPGDNQGPKVTSSALPTPTPTPLPTYTIGGNIQNLLATMKIKLNETEEITVVGDGDNNFLFTSEITSGETYSVSISQHPINPNITCTVGSSSGAATANVSNITVSCPTLDSIEVSSASTSMVQSTTLQYQATGLYSDSSNKDLTPYATWSSSNDAVVSITTDGLATGESAGTESITATLNGVSGNKAITVEAATLQSIQVTPGASTVTAGLTKQFIATGFYDNSTSQNITNLSTWTSSDETKATVSDASGSKGLSSAIAAGTTTVRATLGAVFSDATLNVTAATISSIEVTPSLKTGAVGDFHNYQATAILSDSTFLDVTSEVTWSSSNTTTATISNTAGTKGRVTFLAQGSSTIQAEIDGKTDSSNLTVTSATLQSIVITPASPTYAAGVIQPFTATGTYSDATTENLTNSVIWSSDDADTATASNASGSKGFVTTVAAGSVNISASISGVTASTDLTVSSATLSSLSIDQGDLLISKEIDIPFTVTGTYSDASTADLTSFVTWSSSDTAVGTISNASNNGFFDTVYTGASTQEITITATLGAVNTAANVVITPGTISSILVNPTDLEMNASTVYEMNAYAFYSDGAAIDVTSFVTWSSDNTSAAKVSNAAGNNGSLTALSESSDITITAELSGISGTASLDIVSGVTSETIVGIGLKADYYNGMAFDTLKGSRFDSEVNFDWDRNAAPLGVDDSFSIRWTGKIKAPYTGDYTFYTQSDDGVRLWVDGTQIVDNWTNHATTQNIGTQIISMIEGSFYDITLEFYENGGHAVMELRWECSNSTPAILKSIIDQTYLFPE